MAIQVELTDTFEQWRVKTNQISVTADGFDTNIAILQGNVVTLTSNVTAIRNNVTILQGNVTTLTSCVSTLNTSVTNLQGGLNTANTNISSNAAILARVQVAVVQSGANVQLGNVAGKRVFVNGNNGWVGIGTTNPRGNLEVLGNILVAATNGRYTGLVAGTPTANVIYTLPPADGTTGQSLTTNGTGSLSWATITGGTGGAQTIVTIQSADTLQAGNVVNIYNDGGNFRVRRANAAARIEAHGFVVVGVSGGTNANVYLSGLNANVTSLTPGPVYLSTTGGSVTQTAPTASTQLVHRIGTATSATSFIFDPQTPILLS